MEEEFSKLRKRAEKFETRSPISAWKIALIGFAIGYLLQKLVSLIP